MPLHVVKGDLFESTYEAYAHGCNAKGVMGAGIAKSFSSKYPAMYRDYRSRCLMNQLRPGQCFTWIEDNTVIFNLITQDNPGKNANYEYIQSAFHAMHEEAYNFGIKFIGIPPIGCGIGGLIWDNVEIILKEINSQYREINIYTHFI